jgi:hypothetical protein
MEALTDEVNAYSAEAQRREATEWEAARAWQRPGEALPVVEAEVVGPSGSGESGADSSGSSSGGGSGGSRRFIGPVAPEYKAVRAARQDQVLTGHAQEMRRRLGLEPDPLASGRL